MKVVLSGNGSSANHGCEAILRTTVSLLPGSAHQVIAATTSIEEEKLYIQEGHSTVEFCEYHYSKKQNIAIRVVNILFYKLFHRYLFTNKPDMQKLLQEIKGAQLHLSVGGDNYCYSNKAFLYLAHNVAIKEHVKTILWGCSVDVPNLDEMAKDDLSKYDLIIARESMSYQQLLEINKNTVLFPDPAFILKVEDAILPSDFMPGNTVGINISPLIMNYEENRGITYRNYEMLIQYILECTDLYIALIPHVVWQDSDDRIPLRRLYETYRDNNRVCIVEDQNCMQLKDVISKCRFFVGARTHATIAAYSTCVPTLVVGYSVKAKGIAKDLFGTYENYVIPVQSLVRQDDLVKAFCWLNENEKDIRAHLRKMIPEYQEKVRELPEVVRNI